MSIGEKIKEMRIDRKLTQSQLGEKLGVSQKSIDYWERGVHEPKASNVYQLAKFFAVSSDYLLGLAEY